jgi:hypothetical protein
MIEWPPYGSKCDLCQRPRREGERWWDTHSFRFTFNFCPECEKDRDKECMDLVATVVSEHIIKTREYWATHPEELARHNKETEEYRKNCLDADGFPLDWKRRWWKRIWNWGCRLVGYKYGHK